MNGVQPSWRMSTGLSPRSTGFDTTSIGVGFVVDKLALGRVFLRGFRLSPDRIVPPMLHIHLHINTYFQKDKRADLGTFQKAMLFRNSPEHRTEQCFKFQTRKQKFVFLSNKKFRVSPSP
jgi:hypothetical protein